MADRFGILLLSGTHERAHYAFVLATGAAAIGRDVTLFTTNAGCHALLTDWSGLESPERDAEIQRRGVAGLDELREAATALGIRLLACDSGLAMAALEGKPLMDGAEISGVAAFLADIGPGAIVTL